MSDDKTTPESGASVPPAIRWKREYLSLSRTIDDFNGKHATNEASGNVAKLLEYHLMKSSELLWAQVNGGLDEIYQSDVDALP